MPLTGKFTNIPNGTLTATLSGRKLGFPFDMKALFTNTSGDCSKGEYRQYIKGFFKNNDQFINHRLCDLVWLEITSFHEDGCGLAGTNPGPCTAYGHRECPDHPYDKYLPSRATGCTFEGWDYPGISGNSGDRLEMDLHFNAELIDTATNTVLATANWRVTGSATVPTIIMSSTTTTGAACRKAALSAQLTLSAETGRWKLQLSRTRPAGPEARPHEKPRPVIRLLAANGGPLELVTDHTGYPCEVGGSKAVTEVWMLEFDGNGPQPASVEVELDGETVRLELEENTD